MTQVYTHTDGDPVTAEQLQQNENDPIRLWEEEEEEGDFL